MSNETYGAAYAAAYDQFYAEKDYGIECDLIEASFRLHSPGAVESILDLGCGTGSHARLLAGRGYRITAVDRSKEMLRIAKSKCSASANEIRWIHGELRDLKLNEVFDAVILMFGVVGYLVHDGDVLEALLNIRRHLRGGGLLCFDFWYGPAVLAIGPSDRIRTFCGPDGKLTRRVSSTLSPAERTCHVHYKLERHQEDEVKIIGMETHVVRYFFSAELLGWFAKAGFALVSLTAFPSLEQPVDESIWNAFCVAKAI